MNIRQAEARIAAVPGWRLEGVEAREAFGDEDPNTDWFSVRAAWYPERTGRPEDPDAPEGGGRRYTRDDTIEVTAHFDGPTFEGCVDRIVRHAVELTGDG